MGHQFSLLKKKRFAPFFWTQFLGAFNDNVYKNALIMLIAFNGASLSHFSSNTAINLCGAIFILPFVLFSALSGQLVDKYEKSHLTRIVKVLEMGIAVVVGIALYLNSLTLLMVALFLFGLHSTLFGPVKYSIIPQHLKSYELIGGNGLVESGTFIAILTGTVLGGVLIGVPVYGKVLVTLAIFIIAFSGWWCSRGIPRAPAAAKNVKLEWNIFKGSWKNIRFARKNKGIFNSILGICWFWFYGTFFLYQTPNYTKIYLGGNEHVATFVIACFSIGIGVGSLLCEKLSRQTIEIGLVPLAALGISVFTAMLYFIQPYPQATQGIDILPFLMNAHHLWIVFNLVMLGVCGGLYTVPLYAYVQDRSPVSYRARIVATINILNALFMVGAALYVIFMLKVGFTIPELFLITAALNIAIAIYIFTLIPEFIIRFFVWVMISLVYRLEVHGIENLPEKGSVIYACNHVSFVDVLVLSAVSKRHIRFLMDHRLYEAPFLNWVSKLGRAIPVAPAKENAVLKEQAMLETVKALKSGEVIGIFPEGWITRTGEVAPFRKGIEEIVALAPVPVVPMALRGMWGSFFSRNNHKGKAMSGLPKRFWSKISLHIGQPIPPASLTAQGLQSAVEALLQDERKI